MTKEGGFKEYKLTTPKKNSMFELSQTPDVMGDIKAKTTSKVERNAPRTRGKSEH